MTPEQDLHQKLLTISEQSEVNISSTLQANGPIEILKGTQCSLVEFMAKTIVGQQLSNKAALVIWNRLENLAAQNKCTLETLFIEERLGQIRACGVSKNKAIAINSFSKSVNEFPSKYEMLSQQSDEEISSFLCEHWGIGKWTADMTLIFYFGLTDIFPETDTAVINGLIRLGSTSANAGVIANQFKPYRSYLSLHIWKAIDNGVI